ncbi:ABC transporter permease [Cognaticolwellia mytili]|uniref:ABC transporter permease n=1 Tax=Cognaticolwellia mytili TaxID=1888913 RepID=UPI000A174916|nr:ABC transporter permease [Cognaticolwellia mytili]
MSLYLIKQAYLSLKNKPVFILGVVSTMGITLGALLCVLTLAYVMLLKPLPYPEQERLVKVIYSQYDDQLMATNNTFIHPAAIELYNEFNKNKSIISHTAISFYTEEIITSDQRQPKVNTLYTTPEWFNLLTPPMAKGRYFSQEHSLNHYTPGAVISFLMWKNLFNGQDNILNESVIINGVSHPIIGVTAPSFFEPQLFQEGRANQLWLPWDYNNSEYQQYWLLPDKNIVMFAKLAPKTNIKQAEQLYSNIANDYYHSQVSGQSDVKHWTIKTTFTPLKDVFIKDNYYVLMLLLAGAIGLVLIAASNITNLFIGRTASLHRSIAISMAMGANKRQINEALFIEAVLLLLLSTIAALSLSELGFEVLRLAFTDQLPRVQELSLHALVIIIITLIALCLAYFFVKLSIKTINATSLLQALTSSGKGNAKQIPRAISFWLMCSQIIFSVVLVFSSGVLIKDIVQQLSKPLGFSAKNIVEMEFSVATLEQLGWEEYADKAKELAQQLRLLPEIAEVSFARTPLNDNFKFSVTDIKTSKKYYPFHRNVDQHYLEVVEQRILIGTGFSEQDVSDQTPVALINEAFSQQLALNHLDVIGHKLSVDGSLPFTVIGVISNLQLPTKREVPARFYLTNYGTATYLLLKLKENMTLNRAQIIETLNDIDSQFALTKLDKLSDSINVVNMKYVVVMTTALILVILTLVLSAIGLYGISSYSTRIRRFEIGTRIAIGAKGKDITNMIFKDNIAALSMGLIISTVILLVLYFSFSDNLTAYISIELLPLFLMTLAVISLFSMLACYLPLRQYINQPVIHALKGNE